MVPRIAGTEAPVSRSGGLVKMAEEDAEENPWMAAFELSAASWLETHPNAPSKAGRPEV